MPPKPVLSLESVKEALSLALPQWPSGNAHIDQWRNGVAASLLNLPPAVLYTACHNKDDEAKTEPATDEAELPRRSKGAKRNKPVKMETIEVLCSSEPEVSYSESDTDAEVRRLSHPAARGSTPRGAYAVTTGDLPRQPRCGLPIPLLGYTAADYIVLRNTASQPLFYKLTFDKQRCLKDIDLSGGATVPGASLGVKFTFEWRDVPGSLKPVPSNKESEPIDFVNNMRVSIFWGRQRQGRAAAGQHTAPDYYSVLWDAGIVKTGIRYTFEEEDTNEDQQSGTVPRLSANSAETRTDADDDAKKEKEKTKKGVKRKGDQKK